MHGFGSIWEIKKKNNCFKKNNETNYLLLDYDFLRTSIITTTFTAQTWKISFFTKQIFLKQNKKNI